MAFRDRLARFLVSSKEPKPKGRHWPWLFDTKKEWKLYEKHKKDLAEYETIYMQGGMVSAAINCYPLYILTNGYTFEGKERLIPLVEETCERIDLDSCIYQGVLDALIFGDGYQEITPSAIGEVGGLYPRPARTFGTIYDEYGVITGYRQTISDRLYTKLEINFSPQEIVHIVLDKVGGSPTGISLIARAYDDIMRDTKTAESIAAFIERHGFPKYHILIGDEDDSDIPKDDLLQIGNQFKDLRTDNEFVTNKKVEIKNIDSTHGEVKIYNDWSIQRLCSAIMVPEEMLGLGRGSTEATANVRLQAFYDSIGTYQKRIERIYNTQLIDKITKTPGSVKIKFNDVSPVDAELKAKMYATVASITPGNPFDIFPREHIMRDFGLNPEEYPEEEEEPISEEEITAFEESESQRFKS
jgi:hypothetical protein